MENNSIINKLLNNINLPNKPIINDKTIETANEFLDGYIQSKQLESSSIFKKPNFNTSVEEDQAIEAIYYDLSLRLPSEGENSITNAIDYIKMDEGTVESYDTWDLKICTQMSIKDIFERSIHYKIKLIQRKFKNLYSLLLINTYKFEFIKEILSVFCPEYDEDEELVYQIIILTVSSLKDKCIMSEADHYEFQESLRMPPNWSFCKNLFNSLKVHFILQNKNNNEITLYNKDNLNPKVKIILDFYSIDLIILRHASFDDDD